MDTFEGFHRRLMSPLRRRAVKIGGESDSAASDTLVQEIVEWVAKGVGEDIQRALSQVGARRK